MAYDTFYLGWREEDTHGTSLITDTNSTAYKIGSTVETTPLPDPEWETYEVSPDWGTRTTSSLVKTVPTVTTPAFVFLPHNALPVYWALGKSSTAGTVHTLTAASQVDGIIPELPSLTFHAERIDGNSVLSDWVTQYTGLRNVAARFFCGDDHPQLTASMSWLGLKAEKKAFVLTNKPSDVTGTHTTPLHYNWTASTHKYDGNSIEGLTYWEIGIINGTSSVPGDYDNPWPSAVYQGSHQHIVLTVRYAPRVLTLHDDLLATTVPSANWEFEFVRDATDDKLKFTCTTASTIRHKTPYPNHANEFEVTLEGVVTSLTVEATDQIDAGFYGE